ncbi:DUF1328 domain-containing protein [Nitrosomonas sp. JL21]|uniref:DUF1328 domain-containing protein n=1 Tax=Nitrosomonas sp. JL21 TaxID=153949 RepID=UPI0013692F47|nr:DUF1328 domain-containing protein [Nitrosomonas sp. JL21]MBL8497444.1 DUF1328 domain-containing protein [Nitrosomonas sp.]MCC7090881.1 DUF1328 domain-containing protein [Nitrosomonas sp.]MXS78673.1 DUF1328 domain-containing protein [Nitrosomonas sp. JL21]
MFYWAFIFLIIGLVAGALGLTGVAGTATEIAWIAFWLGLVMGIFFFFVARRSPPHES